MSGFGNSSFGNSAFGDGDPDEGLSLPVNLSIRYINPDTKDLGVDDDGTFLSMPGVRQRVLLALATAKGSVIGSEEFGSTIFEIGAIDSQFDSKVRSSINDALKQLVEIEKVISLDGIEIYKQSGGRVVITVSYTNLIEQDQDNVSLTI